MHEVVILLIYFSLVDFLFVSYLVIQVGLQLIYGPDWP